MGEQAPQAGTRRYPAAEPERSAHQGGRLPELRLEALDEFHRLLARGLVEAVRSTGGYGGGVYLRSPNRRSLVLAVVAGVPRSLLRSWWRLPVTGAVPAAEAFRSSHTVYLADAAETMRRFPEMSVGLPYSFASVYAPVRVRGETVGVVVVLRAASADARLSDAERRRLRRSTRHLGAGLGVLASHGHPVEYEAEPVSARLPADAVAPVRVGMFDWDIDAGRLSVDSEVCAIFGVDPGSFGGRLPELTTRVVREDVPELEAAMRDAMEHGRVLARRFRVRDRDGRARPVELWGRLPEVRGREHHRHLVGAVVDLERGVTAAEAAERLPDGVFSLDQDGAITYANHSFEVLLHTDREELLGRYPWEALPWLSDPAYEDRYRGAMLSQKPASFLARHPGGDWFAFLLYPDAHGLTGRVVPAGPPAGEPEREAGEQPRPAPPLPASPGGVAPPRAGALYHVVHMASVLTKAVTVREVCYVVAEQLLPAFGGQEVAIYTVRDRRLCLAWEYGYPEGFLDRFEAVPLDAPLPGAHVLTSGNPLFFETPRQLTTAYPGLDPGGMCAWAFLPLIASDHQVGSCILGFDRRHVFSSEERTALTALGGLVAQALERARLYDAEFTLARGLQHGLLPHRLPVIEGVDTAARYLPGTQGMEIGGDWYDVMATGSGVALAIGDVEGHNVAAAATMGQLRSALKAFAASGLPPPEVMRRTNQLLTDLDPDLFATCCYLLLDPVTGEASMVRAGHPPPLLRQPDRTTQVLDVPGGPLLGVERTARYPVSRLRLRPGSILALYTDGLVERPGQDIDEGIDWLRTALARSPAVSLEQMADGLVQQARRALERPDDIAVLLTAFVPRTAV